MSATSGESRTTAHWYMTHPGSPWQVAAVTRSAEKAYENSGLRQWLHHHPEGHLCNHQCGPMAYSGGTGTDS